MITERGIFTILVLVFLMLYVVVDKCASYDGGVRGVQELEDIGSIGGVVDSVDMAEFMEDMEIVGACDIVCELDRLKWRVAVLERQIDTISIERDVYMRLVDNWMNTQMAFNKNIDPDLVDMLFEN